MKRITIFSPTESEASALEWVSCPGTVCEVLVSGVGMAGTAASLAGVLAGGAPDLAILAGIAGAYPGLGIERGECVVASVERIADLGAVRDGGFVPLYDKEYHCPLAGKIRSVKHARSLTVNCIGGPSIPTDGYQIENMEGASFFSVCLALGIPFLEIRAVSNLTTDPRAQWNIAGALAALKDGTAAAIRELVDTGII